MTTANGINSDDFSREDLITAYRVQKYFNLTGYTGSVGNVTFDSRCSLFLGGGGLSANGNSKDNVAVGFQALYDNAGGCSNTALGTQALFANSMGSNNFAQGKCALYSNGYGCNNTAIGYQSLSCNDNGSNNIAVGCQSLFNNRSGCNNVALGHRSQFCNNYGNDNNVSIGQCSAYRLQRTGDSEAGYGYGNNNIAIGCRSLANTCNGSNNIALGNVALCANISGNNNVAIGNSALMRANSYGGYGGNIGIGASAGCLLTTGISNTIIGSLPAASGCACTVLIGAGACERMRVDNTGLYINGNPVAVDRLTTGSYSVVLESSGALTLPIGISIDEYNGSHFPRIVADTGKAFSVQGQGSTGSVALQWVETANTSSQIAQVGLNKFSGIAAVTLTAGTSTNDIKVWTFDETGTLTLPEGSTIGETTTTTIISPPGASAGQSLVLRGTSPTGITSDHPSGFAPGDTITITVIPNNSNQVTGTIDYTFTGCTEVQLGRALTGTLTFTSESSQTVTWTVPALSGMTTFTFTLSNPSGIGLAGITTLTLTRTSSSEDSHIHIVAGNTATVDLYLGDDDQYVKIEKNHGNVVIGTSANTSTYNWAFDTDGFFNPASIIYLNSNAGYVERAPTTGYFTSELNNGTYLRKNGLRFEVYDKIGSYRKINSGLINGLAYTANTATTEYISGVALLTPTLTADDQFAVGIQIDDNNNPFADGWDAAHPGDTNQYKFQLAYQAVYIIGGVTYQYTQEYTRTRDAPGVYTETIQEGVLPDYPPGTDTSATVIDLNLDPVSPGWTTVVNRGRAFANARGAAGVVPTQISISGGFSRNLSAALVYGQANTGTTSTSALVDFSGIANYGYVPESSIVGDGYISLVTGGETYIFDKNGITLPNTMRIVSSLNGAVILGSTGWGTTGTGSVSIGDGGGQTGDYSVAIGYGAGTNSDNNSVAIGNGAGENQSTGSVAIGYYTGNQQSEFAVAIGNSAGENQSTGSVAIGSSAGNQQGIGSVAIGQTAGLIHQDQLSVAIGSSAGNIAQGAQAVAIGNLAGYAGQQNNAVAIGEYAGAGFVYAQADYVSTGSTSTTLMISITSGTIVAGMKLYQGLAFSNQTVVTVNSATQITLSAPPDSTPNGPIGFILGQGNHSIAIGTYAGYYSAMADAQEDNTIILNATGTPLIGVNSQTSSLYVAPIRNASGTDGVLQYNTSTKEVSYSNIITVNSNQWTFGTGGALTFPDATVQTTACTNTGTTSTFVISNTSTSTSTTTGALTVAGGVGIGGNLYVGGEIVAQKLTIELTTVTTTLIRTDDIIQTTNTTVSTSTSTGALVIAGGVGVGGGMFVGGTVTATNITSVATAGTTSTTAAALGYIGMPQNSTATSYTLVAGDQGKHIYISATGQTITIPANTAVAFPIGTTIAFIAGPSATTATIAITTDTMYLGGTGTTGNRTLAAYGMATAVKVTSTTWFINGTGLT